MNYDNGLFDLTQVSAITSDLRSLCQDMADRLYSSDPSAAQAFADGLRTRQIAADTFVEKFRDEMIGRLEGSIRAQDPAIVTARRRSH